MSDKKILRGRAPLTIVRGANGVHFHVYHSQPVDPAVADREETKRLVDEGFLEWVVPNQDGGWKLAEDSVSGSAGDPVTVASASIADPNVEGAAGRDPGLVNTAGTVTGSEEDGDKPTAKRGRPSADEKKALVEEAVKAGMSRTEAEKASVPELRAALNKQ